MSEGGDELVWRAVSDTARQVGGDNLGVAVEGQNGQRPGDAPEPPIGWQAGGRWNALRAEAGIVTASAGSGLWNRLRNDDISRYAVGRERGAAVDDTSRNVGWDELFWHWVSDTRCQFGGDNLGLAVEEQNGEMTTTGECPRTPDWAASGRQVKCAAGGVGDGDRTRRGVGWSAMRKWDARWKCYSYSITCA